MAETSSPPKSRIVLIAIDGSEYSKYAFECKYLCNITYYITLSLSRVPCILFAFVSIVYNTPRTIQWFEWEKKWTGMLMKK